MSRVKGVHIERLRIRNFRGIEALDTKVPEAGAVVKGRNASGKSSTPKAIQAALAGRDIGPDAIRIGADRAEILIDLDNVEVRRLITQNGSTLAVTTDGKKVSSPQKWLTELLGSSPIDPVDLFLLKTKERKQRILEALPIKITRDLVDGLKGLDASDLAGVDFDEHALDVLSKIAKSVYDRRTKANAELANVETWLEQNPSRIVPSAPSHEDAARSLQEAETKQREIERQHALEQGRSESRQQNAAAIDRLRAQLDGQTDPGPRIVALDDEAKVLDEQIGKARQELANLERRRNENANQLNQLSASKVSYIRDRQTLEELQAAYDGAPSPSISAEELALAATRVTDAKANLDLARSVLALREENGRRDKEDERRRILSTATGQMTGTLEVLRKELPTKLLSEQDGLPGITMDGDEILVDGVRLDGLSGREQLLFSVEIAKRAGHKGRFLVIDKLEAVDPEMLPEFLERATDDGWQVLAARVDAGDVVFEAITSKGTSK